MKLIKLILTFIILSVGTAISSENLGWQSLELEEKIDSIYRKALIPHFQASEFLIKTRVTFADPGMPKFKDLNKDEVRVSDIEFDESKGDYIAFSKVGLEVPVVGKMHKEGQRRFKELYRYKESYDLFKNIEKIEVKITLSDKLPPERVTQAKNIVKSLDFIVGEIKPEVTYNQSDIQYIEPPEPVVPDGDPKEDLPEEPTLKDYLELIGKYGNAIGMILTTILLGFLAFRLLNKYFEHMKELAAQKDENNEESEDEENEEGVEGEGSLVDIEDSEFKPVYNFERFETLLRNSPEQVMVLVKKWLSSGTKEDELALQAVAQQIQSEDLDKVFSYLSPEEREVWKSLLGHYLEGENLVVANKYITEELIKELVSGQFLDDFELVDLILKLDVNIAKNFIETNQKYGTYLLNLLSASMTSKVLDAMSPERVEEYMEASLKFDINEINENKDEFKSELQRFYDGVKPNIFNFKVQQIVGDMTPEKETLLYQFLSKQKNKELLITTAKKNLPGSLILDLPSDLTKNVMQLYPTEKKVALLYILEEEDRAKILGCYAEGSNARELLDMELSNLMQNEAETHKVASRKDEIWREYVQFARQTINSSEEFDSEIDGILSEWADKLLEKETA